MERSGLEELDERVRIPGQRVTSGCHRPIRPTTSKVPRPDTEKDRCQKCCSKAPNQLGHKRRSVSLNKYEQLVNPGFRHRSRIRFVRFICARIVRYRVQGRSSRGSRTGSTHSPRRRAGGQARTPVHDSTLGSDATLLKSTPEEGHGGKASSENWNTRKLIQNVNVYAQCALTNASWTTSERRQCANPPAYGEERGARRCPGRGHAPETYPGVLLLTQPRLRLP